MFNQNHIGSQSYWQQLIPGLRITDRPLQSFNDTQLKQLGDEGYFKTGSVIQEEFSKRLAAAVQKFSSLGLPPPCTRLSIRVQGIAIRVWL